MTSSDGSIRWSTMPARSATSSSTSSTEGGSTQTFNLNVRGYLFAAQAFAAQGARRARRTPSIVCVGSTNSLAAEKNSVSLR